MRRTILLLALALVSAGCVGGGGPVLSSHGVRVRSPTGWSLVRPAPAGAVRDPRTVLVAGTTGVRAKPSRCQIAAYRIPPAGAAVVIVRWTSVSAAGGGPVKAGRRPLEKLVRVHRPSFECFSGRGAVAVVRFGPTPYQVNVLVGDRASDEQVRDALAVARSFARA